MKSALVFALVLSLLTPSLSFAGQARPTQSWPDVHNWKPGWEVTESTSSSEMRRLYFMSADDTGMTLLDVSSLALPAHAVRTLRHAIAEHPDYVPVPNGVTFKLDDQVSLTSVGLFVRDQKMADYDQIIVRIERVDVERGTAFIEGPIRPAAEWGKIAAAVAFSSPAWILMLMCARGCR